MTEPKAPNQKGIAADAGREGGDGDEEENDDGNVDDDNYGDDEDERKVVAGECSQESKLDDTMANYGIGERIFSRIPRLPLMEVSAVATAASASTSTVATPIKKQDVERQEYRHGEEHPTGLASVPASSYRSVYSPYSPYKGALDSASRRRAHDSSHGSSSSRSVHGWPGIGNHGKDKTGDSGVTGSSSRGGKTYGSRHFPTYLSEASFSSTSHSSVSLPSVSSAEAAPVSASALASTTVSSALLDGDVPKSETLAQTLVEKATRTLGHTQNTFHRMLRESISKNEDVWRRRVDVAVRLAEEALLAEIHALKQEMARKDEEYAAGKHIYDQLDSDGLFMTMDEEWKRKERGWMRAEESLEAKLAALLRELSDQKEAFDAELQKREGQWVSSNEALRHKGKTEVEEVKAACRRQVEMLQTEIEEERERAKKTLWREISVRKEEEEEQRKKEEKRRRTDDAVKEEEESVRKKAFDRLEDQTVVLRRQVTDLEAQLREKEAARATLECELRAAVLAAQKDADRFKRNSESAQDKEEDLLRKVESTAQMKKEQSAIQARLEKEEMVRLALQRDKEREIADLLRRLHDQEEEWRDKMDAVKKECERKVRDCRALVEETAEKERAWTSAKDLDYRHKASETERLALVKAQQAEADAERRIKENEDMWREKEAEAMKNVALNVHKLKLEFSSEVATLKKQLDAKEKALVAQHAEEKEALHKEIRSLAESKRDVAAQHQEQLARMTREQSLRLDEERKKVGTRLAEIDEERAHFLRAEKEVLEQRLAAKDAQCALELENKKVDLELVMRQHVQKETDALRAKERDLVLTMHNKMREAEEKQRAGEAAHREWEDEAEARLRKREEEDRRRLGKKEAELEEKLRALADKVATLRAAEEAATARAKEVAERMEIDKDKARKCEEKLVEELQTCRSEAEALRATVTALKTKEEKLVLEKSVHAEMNKQIESVVKSQKEEIARLHLQLKRETQRHDGSMQARSEEADQAKHEAVAVIDNLTKEVQRLEWALSERDREKADLVATIHYLEALQKEGQTETSVTKAKVAQVVQLLAASHQELQDVHAAIEADRVRARSLDADNRDLVQVVGELEAALLVVQREKAALQVVAQEAEARRDLEAVEANARVKRELLEAEARFQQQLRDRQNAHEAGVLAVESKAKRLLAEREEELVLLTQRKDQGLAKVKQSATEALDDAEKKRKKLENELSEFEHRLAAKDSVLAARETELETLRESAERREEDLKRACADKEREWQEWSAAMVRLREDDLYAFQLQLETVESQCEERLIERLMYAKRS